MEEKELYVRITIEGCPIVETRENFKKMMLGGDFIEVYFDVDYLAVGADCKIEMIEMSKAEFEALPQFDGF